MCVCYDPSMTPMPAPHIFPPPITAVLINNMARLPCTTPGFWVHCHCGTHRVLFIFDDPSDVPPVYVYDHNTSTGFTSCRNVCQPITTCAPRRSLVFGTRFKRPMPSLRTILKAIETAACTTTCAGTTRACTCVHCVCTPCQPICPIRWMSSLASSQMPDMNRIYENPHSE